MSGTAHCRALAIRASPVVRLALSVVTVTSPHEAQHDPEYGAARGPITLIMTRSRSLARVRSLFQEKSAHDLARLQAAIARANSGIKTRFLSFRPMVVRARPSSVMS